MRCSGAPGALAAAVAGAAVLAAGCGSSSASSPGPPVSTASTAPPARPQMARCLPRNGHLLAASRTTVVYTVPRRVPGGPGPRHLRAGVAVFGCQIGVYRRVGLGVAARVEAVTLNRTAVAYATTAARGIDTSETRVVVADVRRGHVLYSVPAGRIAIAPSSVSVDSLALTADGTLAWIQHGGTGESPGYSVHAATVAQPDDHELAAGSAIKPRSLAVSGSRVSWVQGGQRHSAAI